MHAARLFLFTALCATAFAASAQWQWVDKDGRKVFSDRAPPVDIPERNILKQPNQPSMGTAPASAPAPAACAPRPPATAALPRLSGKDPELDARKKQAEEEEAAKKKAEEDKVAATRAENCQRARQGQATLDSGMRMSQLDAQGERIVMDDSARAAEAQRLQAVIGSECR